MPHSDPGGSFFGTEPVRHAARARREARALKVPVEQPEEVEAEHCLDQTHCHEIAGISLFAKIAVEELRYAVHDSMQRQK